MNFLMEWRTFLKTVAKDGIFCSQVIRWKLQKMLFCSRWQALWPRRLFYIMLLWLCSTIMQHYIKKLGRKNSRCKSRSVRVIAPITVTVIFLGALGRSGNFIQLIPNAHDICLCTFNYYRLL